MAGFAASLVVAVWAYLGPAWGLGCAVASVAIGSSALWAYGAIRIRVDPDGLRAGACFLGWAWCGPAEPLSSEEARAALASSSGRPHLMTRPYIAKAVRVGVADEADPHRSWLLSSRRPEQLAAAIENARQEAR